MLDTPVSFRSVKISSIGSGKYLDGDHLRAPGAGGMNSDIGAA